MLSKSKILSGLQCEKRLYLEKHHPEFADHSQATEASFRVGHDVGAVARALRPNGRLIGHDNDLAAAIRQTRALLATQGDVTLFEPTFSHGGVLVRADLLERKRGRSKLTEVKASTSVKDYHHRDVATQAWVLNGSGIDLADARIAHVDTQFVYQGNGKYEGLFVETSVAKDIAPLTREVAGWVRRFEKMLRGKLPDVETGRHCHDPFECPFLGHCSRNDPEYPIEILPRGGKLVAALRAEGHRDLRKVPKDRLTNANHLRVWRASRSGKPEFAKGAGIELKAFAYPRYYLDFETAQMAIPVWKGLRPYEKIPFQWSCHVERRDGSLEHREFLDLTGAPTHRAFAESLIGAIGAKGPVFVYSSFERTTLKALAERLKNLRPALNAIAARLVDLRPIAERSYYHPAMKGSWSIKGMAPTIAPELDYGNLGDIRDGGAAQDAYLAAIHPQTPPDRREAIRRELIAYCRQDTLALVKLAAFLQARC